MNPLVIAALGMAAILAILSLPCLVGPEQTVSALGKFPRNRVAAGVLTAVCMFWSAMIVYSAELGRFESLKPGLMLLAVVLFFLVFFLMDELLASRALGGLFLLAATPILSAARSHDSSLRLVPVVLAYLIVVAGMALVLNPYLFRKAVERIGVSSARWRAIGGVGMATAILLLALALLVY